MLQKYYTSLFFLFCVQAAWAQSTTDSLTAEKALEEVTITATRSERRLSTVPMPVMLISQAQIKQIGSLRLNEVLQEQTGLAIVQDHGQGLQIQGLAPDYTLILIDGEPMIGRTAGTLELSRVAVGNIRQIEIVKGASSSLYGSEALAGVVNIITEKPQQNQIDLSLRQGANNTSDIGASLHFRKEKLGATLFVNRYASGGYDVSPQTFGQTVEPFETYTLQNKWYYQLAENSELSLSMRYFSERQQARFALSEGQVGGEGKVQDWSILPSWQWRKGKWQWQARFYQAVYENNSLLNWEATGAEYERTFFRQTFARPELQAEYYLSDAHVFTFGGGHIWESVAASRYTSQKFFQTRYAFVQHEWQPHKAWNITTGARFDAHSVYGQQLSPKIALQYEILPSLSWRASLGRGFKAPDFRQLYLNFTNTIAGYSVFGTEELPEVLRRLQAEGQLAEILFAPEEVGRLQAESAWGLNTGFRFERKGLVAELNVFRNDIENLIESQAFARRSNGQNIFSYRNLRRIYTQGIELNLQYKLHPSLSLAGGYQYLEAYDKEVLAQIERGELFRRDPQTLQTVRLTRQDYGGLMGRSRHMANVKLFYENKKQGTFANLRAVYRGRFGLADRNGNLILDADNEYVADFWTLNASVAKSFYKEMFRLQAGIDNLLNYRDEASQPNIAGRLWWLSLQVHLAAKK